MRALELANRKCKGAQEWSGRCFYYSGIGKPTGEMWQRLRRMQDHHGSGTLRTLGVGGMVSRSTHRQVSSHTPLFQQAQYDKPSSPEGSIPDTGLLLTNANRLIPPLSAIGSQLVHLCKLGS